jgi:hypothetical protein
MQLSKTPMIPSGLIRYMHFTVIRSRHKRQIGKSIVQLVTVNVMNYFASQKFSPKMFFKNTSVFKVHFPLNGYALVAIVRDTSRTVWSSSKLAMPVPFKSGVMRFAQFACSSPISAAFKYAIHRPMCSTRGLGW